MSLGKLKLSPFLKDLFITTVTSALTVLAFIVMARVLAVGLGPEKFGAYSLVRRILATIEPLSTLNLGIALARYVAASKDAKANYGYLFTSVFLAISVNALILALAFAFKDKFTILFFQDASYSSLLPATSLLIFGYSLFIILYGFYRGASRMWEANIWQLLLVAAAPLAMAVIYLGSKRVDLIVMATAACFFASLAPLLFYAWKALKQGSGSSLPYLKDLLKYGVPRIPGILAYAGIFAIGTFMSPYFGSLKDAGFLVTATSVLKVIEGGMDSFSRVVLPKATQVFASGDTGFLKEKVADILAFCAQVGLFITLQLVLWSDKLILVWLGPEYAAIIPLMRILALAVIPFLIYSLLKSVIDAVEIKAVNARNLYISFLATLVSCFVLAFAGSGVKGLAIGTVIGLFVLGLLTVIYLCRSLGVSAFVPGMGGCVVWNAALLSVSCLAKYFITGVLAVFALEAAVFLIYCFIMYKSGARWMLELRRRVSIMPATQSI